MSAIVAEHERTARASASRFINKRLLFYKITLCYDKQVTIFAVAIAIGDSLNIRHSSVDVLYGEFT